MFGFLKKNKGMILLISYSVILFSLLAIFIKPNRYGDGFEYIYMLQALSTHGTPDVSETDIQIRQEKLKTQSQFESFMPKYSGFFEANNQKMYSYHFWLYPLFLVPMQWIFEKAGLEEFRVFAVTNTLFFLLALWAVWALYPGLKKRKYLLVFFYAFSPVLPYLKWTHPEAFSTALVMLALLFYVRHNLFLTVLFSAVAACQNPPIALLTIYGGGVYLWQTIQRWRKERIFNIGHFLLMGLCGSPLLFSPLFYWFYFNTPNLISKVGSASFQMVTLEKIMSFFVDLNQGLVVWAALPVLLFFILIIYQIARRNFKSLIWPLMVLGMVILSATTHNWNHGQSVLIRYATWIYPIMIFYLVEFFPLQNKKQYIILWIAALSVCLQAFLNNTVFENELSYVRHKAVPRYLLRHYPSFYNPEFEIFAERTLQTDGSFNEKLPILFMNKTFSARKMLTSYEALEKKLPTFSDPARVYLMHKMRSMKDKPRELFYISLPEGLVSEPGLVLPEGSSISLAIDHKALKGLDSVEEWGRWNASQEVSMNLTLPRTDRNFRLEFNVNPFVNSGQPRQEVDVYVNDKKATQWTFKMSSPASQASIFIPQQEIAAHPTVRITFYIQHVKSPQELGFSNDARPLGLGFISVKAVPVD